MEKDLENFIKASEDRLKTEKMPLLEYREAILQALLNNQCLVLQADTGLGKTTQLPQYLFLDCYFQGFQIYITQPRRIAAYAVAKRVSEEFNYNNISRSCLSIRELSSVSNTPIVYFAESCFLNHLLTEIYNEIPLKSCKALIIDEVHERNVDTDVILALVKQYVLNKRKDFKLIVTSATIQQDKILKYLNCPIIRCPGSIYPVKINYLKKYDNYFYETVGITNSIIEGKLAKGCCNETILVFLSGYDEIIGAKSLISKRFSPNLVDVFILYGHLDFKDQQDIINSRGKNIKVVISTNIAESSLTVPGVTCVVDSGREKAVSGSYHKDFRVKLITKMSAAQRKGRAGRTNSGDCYRIYTEEEYNNMDEFRKPAILCRNIGLTILKFMKYGIFDIESLPLIDHPDSNSMKETNQELILLKLIEWTLFHTYKLTEIGKFALELDIMPMLGKFIYHSYKDYKCGDEAVMLASIFSCSDFIFLRTEAIDENFDLRDQYMLHPSIVVLGDFITSLFTFRQYLALMCNNCLFDSGECSCMDKKKTWTKKFFACEKNLKSALRLYKDLNFKLEEIFSEQVYYFSQEDWEEEKVLVELSLSEFGSDKYNKLLVSIIGIYKEFYTSVFEIAIISSFFKNLVQYRGENLIDAGYLNIFSKEIIVPHPSSPLCKLLYSNPPRYLIFFEISVTSNIFMKYITPIEISKVKLIHKEWLETMNFTEDIEPISGLVFQNIGPAYMKELVGSTGGKVYDLEKELKSKGATGVLILPDSMKNNVKIRIPYSNRKLSEELLREILSSKQKEVIRKNTVHVPYSKGMVLLVSPGAVISDIIYNEDNLVYQINNLKNYLSYNEALNDIQNTFDFLHFNLIRNQGDVIGVIYFKSQAQAQKAQETLLIRPLIGKNGPVSELQKKNNLQSQPCLRVSAGIQPKQLQVMLEYYGDTRYIHIKPFENTTVAYVRYLSSTSTALCLTNFKQWAEDEYGVQSSVHKLQDGIIIPRELVSIGIDEIVDYIETISAKYNIDLHISGKKVMRIFGNLNALQPECTEAILDLVNFDIMPVTLDLIKALNKAFINLFEQPVTWEDWQHQHKVYCKYLHFRSALAVYGLPSHRQYVLKEIQKIFSNLMKNIFTVEFKYTSLKEVRKIELFKKKSVELNVDININRRKGCFTLTGTKDSVNEAFEKLKLQQQTVILDENCAICMNQSDESSISLSLCGHRFHSYCLNTQIKNSISEAGVSGFPINCILCMHPLTHNDWTKVLNYNELQNLFSASLVQFTSSNSSYSHCENPNCDYIYNQELLKNEGNLRKCPRCKGFYCLVCKKQVFGMGHEVKCEMERMKKYKLEDIAWLEENTSPCPRCLIRIEKNKGCNHLICPRCKTHFCFLCKQEITEAFIVDHYKNPERICFNKYMIDV